MENNSKYINKGVVKEPLILEPEDWSNEEWNVLLKLFGLSEAKRIKISNYEFEAYGIESSLGQSDKLDESIRRQIIIKTHSRDEELRIGSKIHDQLVGNPDYKENRICLNLSDARDDNTENEVHLYIFTDSESDPEILI